MSACCFTGHRTVAREDVAALVRIIDRHILSLLEQGVFEFRTGGALGFDTLAALRVLTLRERDPRCRLVLFLPCRDQSKLWREGERALYDDILSHADEVHYVSEQYTPFCMQQRNHAMVDGCDVCLAYLKRGRSGTQSTALYAMRQGLTVHNLAEELD